MSIGHAFQQLCSRFGAVCDSKTISFIVPLGVASNGCLLFYVKSLLDIRTPQDIAETWCSLTTLEDPAEWEDGDTEPDPYAEQPRSRIEQFYDDGRGPPVAFG